MFDSPGFFSSGSPVAEVSHVPPLAEIIERCMCDRQQTRWPLEQFKVAFFEGNLHISMIGHMSRSENPATVHLRHAFASILKEFMRMESNAIATNTFQVWMDKHCEPVRSRIDDDAQLAEAIRLSLQTFVANPALANTGVEIEIVSSDDEAEQLAHAISLSLDASAGSAGFGSNAAHIEMSCQAQSEDDEGDTELAEAIRLSLQTPLAIPDMGGNGASL